MENSSLMVLWNNALTKPLNETEERKRANEKFVNLLDEVRKIDQRLMFEIEEAISELENIEMYNAFDLGFQEAVGLLMGCAK
ncbi:hypothetical protein GH810_02800 [Acetobacterium paludosum]|uniref:Uncharacterized protein n=1 Tax=Acetobacterium paludosum TaxID=52693 RepID=A0A923KVQ0_9FIRM|nr:hypothetical protein [Acetobacterium paludosum]MBC3887238.1 hypothetical protein [Acetobacterium paludosum]